MSHVVELTDDEITLIYMAMCDRAESMRTEAWRNDEEDNPESYWSAEAERAAAFAERVLTWEHSPGTSAEVGPRLSVSG